MARRRGEELYYTVKCRHFTGIQHDTCALGIAYATLRDIQPGYPMARWPCIQVDGPTTTVCDKLDRYTAEESKAMCAEDDAMIDKMLADMAAGLCPTCGTKVETETQVGKCVYAAPCGHRLGQGKAKKK